MDIMDNYQTHPLTLSFLDTNLEAEFKAKNDQSQIPFYRLAILLGFGGIMVLAIWSNFIIPQHILEVSLMTYLIVLPYFAAVFYVTFRKPMPRILPSLMVGGNFIGATLVTYMAVYYFEDYQFLAVAVLFFTIWVHFFSKLRFKLALFLSIFDVVLAQTLMLWEGGYALEDLLSITFGFWFGLITVNFSAYYHERIIRKSFIQQILIKQQQAEIAVEREKSETLLLNILPEKIAIRLKNNTKIIADRFESVSVLFADIVNFTQISASMKPNEVVEFLNYLFIKFDQLTEKYHLEKIKTIGDAYMVAAGIPEINANHAKTLFLFAQDMLHILEEYNETHDQNLQIRIGISSGPVVAGVIGKKKFIYDLWGDTVNIASRMESYGQQGRIQVSSATYNILKDDFEFEKIADVKIKGKGVMDVYLWTGNVLENAVVG